MKFNETKVIHLSRWSGTFFSLDLLQPCLLVVESNLSQWSPVKRVLYEKRGKRERGKNTLTWWQSERLHIHSRIACASESRGKRIKVKYTGDAGFSFFRTLALLVKQLTYVNWICLKLNGDHFTIYFRSPSTYQVVSSRWIFLSFPFFSHSASCNVFRGTQVSTSWKLLSLNQFQVF